MIFKSFVCSAATAAIVACSIAAAAAQGRGQLQPGDDLAATARIARDRGAAIMLAFTQASCRYCAVAKRDYLVPMQDEEPWRSRVVMVEIDLDIVAPLRDFAAQTVSRRTFSARYGVARVPTVIVVDAAGVPLAGAIVGLQTEDFYRLYLEQAVEEALIKLRAARGDG